jgi:thiamine-phosphate pyrophosphorylase
MKPLSQCRLYTFVDAAFLHGRDPAVIARQLCEGGSDIIQLRAKGCPPEEVRHLAAQVLEVTRQAGVPLVINDHPRIALQLGAEFCHLGQEDFFDAGYRQAAQVTGCPKEMQLGLSTHGPEEAQKALRANPDYIAIGPVFATSTKPTAAPVTLDYVRWAAEHVSLPWFAIGGINLETLGPVLAAGARRICVVSAILNAPDIAAACREYHHRLAQFPLT